MVYTGHRYVLPGQTASDKVHPHKGEGSYSNWSRFSTTQLLEDAPLEDVEPGQGKFPSHPQRSQMFTGEFEYKPMESQAHQHSPQDAPYLYHKRHEYHGVTGAEVFRGGYGHELNRDLYYSVFHQDGMKGPEETRALRDPGHSIRAYGSATANMGPVGHYTREGQTAFADPGDQSYLDKQENPRYGFEQVRVHQGVPSSTAL